VRTEGLGVHDERVGGGGGGPCVGDLHQDAVALLRTPTAAAAVVVTVAVVLPLQGLDAAHLAADPAARHRLEVRAGAQRLGAQLLCVHRRGTRRQMHSNQINFINIPLFTQHAAHSASESKIKTDKKYQKKTGIDNNE